MHRRTVVLPAPLGPHSATVSPRPTSKPRSSSAVTLPKRFVSPRIEIAAVDSWRELLGGGAIDAPDPLRSGFEVVSGEPATSVALALPTIRAMGHAGSKTPSSHQCHALP